MLSEAIPLTQKSYPKRCQPSDYSHRSSKSNLIFSNPASGAHMKQRFIHFFAFGSSFVVLSLLATTKREELEAEGEVLAVGCIVELI